MCPPRASGDEPDLDYGMSLGASSAPRERGWALAVSVLTLTLSVRPARAGMSPSGSHGRQGRRRPPRASGDEPEESIHETTDRLSAPRERG